MRSRELLAVRTRRPTAGRINDRRCAFAVGQPAFSSARGMRAKRCYDRHQIISPLPIPHVASGGQTNRLGGHFRNGDEGAVCRMETWRSSHHIDRSLVRRQVHVSPRTLDWGVFALVHLGVAESAPCAQIRKAFGTHPRHHIALFGNGQRRIVTMRRAGWPSGFSPCRGVRFQLKDSSGQSFVT